MKENLSRRSLIQAGMTAIGAAALERGGAGRLQAQTRGASPSVNRGHAGSLQSILSAEMPEIAGNRFLSAMRSVPGGSYKLGGEVQPSSDWTMQSDTSEQLSDGTTKREMVLQTPEGLQVTRHFRFYPEQKAVEHQFVFANTTSKELDALSEVLPLDLFFQFSRFERLVAYTPGVGEIDAVYPDPIWRLTENLLLKDSGSGMPWHEWQLATPRDLGDRGAHHPMVFVVDKSSGEGMFLELGWAGRWAIDFKWVDYSSLPFQIPPTYALKHPDTLEISGGMPGVDIRLRPGQTISSPIAVYGFFKDGLMEGRNLLRRLKLNHFRLPWPAEAPEPPTLYDFFYSSRDKLVEKDFKKLADHAAHLGIEYFFIGADWQPEQRFWGPVEEYDSPTTPWSFPVDPEIFPSSSLRPFSDYVHGKGMKFGLWFDAERAFDNWPVVDEHPDWFLRDPSGESKEIVIDLANSGALNWMVDRLSDAIKRWDVDFFFHDRFGGGERFWNQFDSPGQTGLTQIKYLEGRWEMWRRLNERFPHLLILNAGGHDIGSMRNTHLTMAGRHTGDGNASRYDNSVLNWFYPSVHVQSDFISYKESYREPYRLNAWLSRFPAMLGIGDPIGHWSEATTADGKKAIEVYKSIRHLLKGDFYPFFPPAETLESWDGWQFHDPASGEGLIMAFRLRYCEQPSSTLRMHALRKGVQYVLRDPFEATTTEVAGNELAEKGLTVALEKDGARLLRYAPKNRA